jgi:uncharacterized protein YidB (DUF937 family)
MGLLDALLGQVMGGMMSGAQSSPGAQGQNPLLMMALRMLQQNGGLQGVLGKFQQAGYGDHAQSWIGTGQNMPVTPDILSQIFGQGQLGQIAQQMGMSHDEAAGGLAQALPQVMDHLTPHGHITDDSNDLVAQALAILEMNRKA